MGLQDAFGVNCRGLVDRWMDGQTDACIRTDRPPPRHRNAVRFGVITQAGWFIKLVTHSRFEVCVVLPSHRPPPPHLLLPSSCFFLVLLTLHHFALFGFKERKQKVIKYPSFGENECQQHLKQ